MCILKFHIFKSHINSSILSSVPCFTRQIQLALSLVMDRGTEWWDW